MSSWIIVAYAVCMGANAQAAPAKPDEPATTAEMPPHVAVCIGCHGVHGEGNVAAGFPRLGGTGAAYLSEQLANFASGRRSSAVMQPFAQALSPEQRETAAHYFSTLPAAAPTDARLPATPSQTGAWLATRGRWNDGLPACVQCHGPGGTGVGQHFPPLAGQPAAYLARQLSDWKTGQRPPGPRNLMPAIAKKLSDAEITAVAEYYATLGTSAPQGAKPEGRP